jgi:hypothetical protein
MTVGRIPVIEGGIQPTIFDAKADLLTATANDTPARLAVGANTYVVMADSTTATGLKYGGAWTSYTPTTGSLTIGNGTLIASYMKIGELITWYAEFTLGSTSSVSSDPYISMPFAQDENDFLFQDATFRDVSAGTYQKGFTIGTGTNSYPYPIKTDGTWASSGGGVSSAQPFTWATGDQIILSGTYRKAA